MLHNLKKFYGGNTLLCFSPPVMALTFAAEMIMLVYVVARYSLNRVSHRLIVLVLLFLALFQLSEYGVCEGLVCSETVWARIGFVSITMLPALGLHLVQKLRGDKTIGYSYFGYFMALIFIVIFTFFNTFESIGCQGNYAIFQIKNGIGGAYFIYYYALLVLGATLALLFWKDNKETPAGRALFLTAFGYASFTLPATVVHFVFSDSVTNGLPSIMCGFALIFALVLTFGIAKHSQHVK